MRREKQIEFIKIRIIELKKILATKTMHSSIRFLTLRTLDFNEEILDTLLGLRD